MPLPYPTGTMGCGSRGNAAPPRTVVSVGGGRRCDHEVNMTTTNHEGVVSELVRDAPIPLVLIDLVRRTIVEASDPLLSLVDQPRERVVGRLVAEHSADPSTTATLLDLLATGELEGYQTLRKIRRRDGETILVTVWTRVLTPEGARTHVLTQLDLAPANDGTPART